jgi:phage terminase large subunit-like protein
VIETEEQIEAVGAESAVADPEKVAERASKKLERADALPNYTTEELANLLEQRREITQLIYECQNALGKMFNTHEINTVLGLNDYLGLDEQYIVLPFFWLPEDTLQLRVRRDHVMYDKWEKQGFIMTTEGNVVHYGFIEQFILKLGERFNIREIAYDRWNATMMVQQLEDDGFTMVPFGQGFRDMSPPTKELMRLVLERKLNHGGHPVLRWNMDNAFVRTDPAGNLKIDKEKSTEKVDGAVALVMALDRAMKNQNGSSVYDDRGLLIL